MACANEGVVSHKLQEEVFAVCNTPLDEGPGEGVHRATHNTKKRADASREPWLLASIRQKQSFDSLDSFLRDHGDVGKTVFEFEWNRFKRLLQAQRRHSYTPAKMKDKPFFKRFYRLKALPGDENTSGALKAFHLFC